MSPIPANYPEVELRLSQANPELTRCPRCAGDHVFLEGDFLRHYVEEFQAGESAAAPALGQRCKLVSRVSCPACQVTFLLVPDDLYNEKVENLRVRTELAKRDGLLQGLDAEKTLIQ